MSERTIIKSNSVEDTEKLGEQIGGRLRGGEVIELISDLGGGKTTFVRGLARGAKSSDHVASPTFTVSKIYKAPNFEIHHFDFYRLGEVGLMEHELADLLNDPMVVIVVEWGQIIQHVLPEKRLTIEIQQSETEGRDIYISSDPSLRYLLEDS